MRGRRLPSAPFTVTSNRQVALALLVGGQESGGATFHIDTGNSGISIADAHITASLGLHTANPHQTHFQDFVAERFCCVSSFVNWRLVEQTWQPHGEIGSVLDREANHRRDRRDSHCDTRGQVVRGWERPDDLRNIS